MFPVIEIGVRSFGYRGLLFFSCQPLYPSQFSAVNVTSEFGGFLGQKWFRECLQGREVGSPPSFIKKYRYHSREITFLVLKLV